MAQRRLLSVCVVALALCSVCPPPSEAAPTFKFKKSFGTLEGDKSRAERRFVGGTSPIHFIQPFAVGMPRPAPFSPFFAPQSGGPSSSSVYRLPLTLFSNGKPYAVFRGPPKPHRFLEFPPQPASNVVRLPLKYVSDAKPIGVYFKDPSFNYL